MNNLVITLLACFLGLTTVKAHPGIGIVIDSRGNVFYTDLNHVWKISPDGHCSIAVKHVHTHELYIDEDDNLYGEHEYYKGEATDKWGTYVWCLSSDGVFEKIIPEVEGFLDNNTLVRDDQGNSYYSKKIGDRQRLYKHSLSGQNTMLSKHKFKDIRWMYYSKTDQHLYVIDYLELKKVSPDGNVVVIADNLKESSPSFDDVADRHYIFRVWTSVNNDIYVALYGAGKVKCIRTDGEIKTIFESEKGWSPCSGMTDSDGRLWIMEFSKSNKTRVRKINNDGTYTVYGG